MLCIITKDFFFLSVRYSALHFHNFMPCVSHLFIHRICKSVCEKENRSPNGGIEPNFAGYTYI